MERDREDPLEGQIIGNYALTTAIGQGAAGTVYLAEHTFLERKKAIKILSREAAQNPVLCTFALAPPFSVT